MSRWKRWAGSAARKLRGILGLSLIGGTLTAGLGLMLGLGLALWDFAAVGTTTLPYFAEWLMVLGTVFFGIGAVGTGAFATLLAITGRNVTMDTLSFRHVALLGAIVGGGLPMGVIAMDVGPAVLFQYFMDLLPSLAFLSAGGAALTTTLVALGKRAHARELEVVGEVAALAEGSDED